MKTKPGGGARTDLPAGNSGRTDRETPLLDTRNAAAGRATRALHERLKKPHLPTLKSGARVLLARIASARPRRVRRDAAATGFARRPLLLKPYGGPRDRLDQCVYERGGSSPGRDGRRRVQTRGVAAVRESRARACRLENAEKS